jgi:AhpD family alkylhydroperoxidase
MVDVARIEVGQIPLLARPFFDGGDPGPIVGALAQVPELLVAAMPFIGTALSPSGLDFRTKEIVIVRTSALAGCRYCVQSHAVVALDAGLTRDQVAALQDPDAVVVEATGGFDTPRDRALIEWIDVVAGGGPVDDDARARVLGHWADHEVVELTAVIGTTLLLNRFATALALPTSSDVLARLGTEGLL